MSCPVILSDSRETRKAMTRGDVRWLADAAQGGALGLRRDQLGEAAEGVSAQTGPGGTGRDRVDADASGGQLARHVAGEDDGDRPSSAA